MLHARAGGPCHGEGSGWIVATTTLALLQYLIKSNHKDHRGHRDAVQFSMLSVSSVLSVLRKLIEAAHDSHSPARRPLEAARSSRLSRYRTSTHPHRSLPP